MRRLKAVKQYMLASLAMDSPELFCSVRLFRQGSATSEPMVRDDGRTHVLPSSVPAPDVGMEGTSDQASESSETANAQGALKDDDGPPSIEAIFGADVAELQSVLHDDTASSVTNTVDFPQLQVTLLDIAKYASEIADLVTFDIPERHALNDAADASLGLWVGCTLSRRHLLTVLIHTHKDAAASGVQAFQQLQERFLPVMLCKSRVIRREAAFAVRQVCVNVSNAPPLPTSPQGDKQITVPPPTTLFLNLLLSALPNEEQLESRQRTDYGQYFDLLCALIHDYLYLNDRDILISSEENFATLDLPQLMQQMVHRIHNHHIVETNAKDAADTLLMGSMKVLVTLLGWAPEMGNSVGKSLIEHVFSTCLYRRTA